MHRLSDHKFHIPVMGLSFTIDTPLKVAHFGISSCISIIEDHLIEKMREVISKNEGLVYIPISIKDQDYRAKRITAYLNLIHQLVKERVVKLKSEAFKENSELENYFKMLPENSTLKISFLKMLQLNGLEREQAQLQLKEQIVAGSIDVNIMTKVDGLNYSEDGEALPQEYSNALSALRGYAQSDLDSSIIFSAGLNPRLFNYCTQFEDFFPDKNGDIKKRIILKVSDFRSAAIQGKYLAKKGLWVSEFRIESGINCGGHAFIADGLLFGPILEEFKHKRKELLEDLTLLYNQALTAIGRNVLRGEPEFKITAQGGIGTSGENDFLLNYYQLDATGWGSPFLLVPEVTNVDRDTLESLSRAKKGDYFLSHASPLGVPFHNFRDSSSEAQRKARIQKRRPGSPCYKKFLSSNTEFTSQPICTASREYQNLKIKQLRLEISDDLKYEIEVNKVIEKDCLCEGLGASALLKNKTQLSHNLSAVAICPGPNLAYFSGKFSLKQMLDHIYGRTSVLNSLPRPHVFVNELRLYMDYLKKEMDKKPLPLADKVSAYFETFKGNLLKGIDYYDKIADSIYERGSEAYDQMTEQLNEYKNLISNSQNHNLIINS